MKNYMDLTGRVAVVTGASSGLGYAFSKALAENGAKVAAFARRMDKLNALKEDIEAAGGECLPVVCDVTDEANIVAAVQQVVDHFGKIDILVNNAGYMKVCPTVDFPLVESQKVVDTSITAYFLMAREVGKTMIENKYGRIINIASMYGLRASVTGPIPGYWASKGAIPQLTRGWAWEFAPYNITVNSIAPGFFLTELMPGSDDTYHQLVDSLIPLKRIGHPEEMDGLVQLLASDGAAYITGQTIPIDGGKTAI